VLSSSPVQSSQQTLLSLSLSFNYTLYFAPSNQIDIRYYIDFGSSFYTILSTLQIPERKPDLLGSSQSFDNTVI
jgi:hypothetical protein